MVADTARQLSELTVDESLELLAGATVGRLAYVDNDEATIVPVNYIWHQGAVVFRTTYGHTLDSIANAAKVSFEVDGIDPSARRGWSVIVRGKAEEVWQPEDLEEVRALPLEPWAPGERAHYVRILPAQITGRRIA